MPPHFDAPCWLLNNRRRCIEATIAILYSCARSHIINPLQGLFCGGNQLATIIPTSTRFWTESMKRSNAGIKIFHVLPIENDKG